MELQMGQVLIRKGNILEGTADLTIFPCSAKGTTSSSMKRWQELYKIPSPPDLNLCLTHGGLSAPFPFPGPQTVTKSYCYAAAVLNDYSSDEVVEKIGQQIGNATKARPDMEAALKKRGLFRRLFDAMLLRPSWQGIGLDVKELLE
jgi:hypothetical protein